MSTVYFPSCKFTEFSPESSRKITAYLARRYGMQIEGCCRPNHTKLTPEDRAYCVCNTCAAICEESSPADVHSIWELLQNDEEFPWPDYHGRTMALQDCWRCHDKPAEQDAVRVVLRKMNIHYIELAENREKNRFCGTSLYIPLHPENARFAPKRFVENGSGFFVPTSPEEQKKLMEAHCASIPCDEVVCYCVPCTKGIRLGGKTAHHLMDLALKNL